MGGASTEIGDGRRRAARGGALGADRGGPHRPPAPAAQRGGQALRARRRPGDDRRRPGPRGGAAGRYGGATVDGGVVDVDTRGPRPPIPLDAARPARVAGGAYTPGQVVELLTAVGCAVDGERPRSQVTPPSWRPDLADPADLVEEVVRLAGYDDVPSVLPTAPPGRGLTDVQRRRRGVGRTLAEAGYVEAPAYPFVATRRSTPSGWPTTTSGARSSSSATRCRRRSRRCAPRCCPACWPRWPATSPAGSATSPCSSTVRCSRAASAAGADPRRRPASGRRDDRRAARRRAGAAVARGGGAGRQPRAARLVGHGPSGAWADAVRPPAWSPPPPGSS